MCGVATRRALWIAGKNRKTDLTSARKSNKWRRKPNFGTDRLGRILKPVRLDTHWTARQMGRGREYVTSEKCWCMYPKSDTETCIALWVCVNLDPDHAELSPGEPIDRRFSTAVGAETMHDAPTNVDQSSIVGGHGIRADNTGWVNVMMFNLQKLARKLENSFVVLWAGFRTEYYEKA